MKYQALFLKPQREAWENKKRGEGVEMKLTRIRSYYVKFPEQLECKISSAIMEDDKRRITLDFEDENGKGLIELKSDDGIRFNGEYSYRSTRKPMGACQFNLYQNSEEYFLMGKYQDVDGDGIWWVGLKPK